MVFKLQRLLFHQKVPLRSSDYIRSWPNDGPSYRFHDPHDNSVPLQHYRQAVQHQDSQLFHDIQRRSLGRRLHLQLSLHYSDLEQSQKCSSWLGLHWNNYVCNLIKSNLSFHC